MDRLGRALLRELVEPLLDAVYPPRCRLCGDDAPDDLACEEHRLPGGLGGPRCDRCAGALPPALPDGTRCAECRRRPPRFARVVAIGDYDAGPLRDWLLALKHAGRRDLAHPLGARLAGAWLAGADAPGRPDAAPDGGDLGAVLVPVPLHPLRRLERGYDQALGIARAIALPARVPVLRALVRTRSTAPQGTPGAVSRAANVACAFRVARAARRRLRGREVWLVDDVMTSGATASECASTLRAEGARRVGVLVAARAGNAPWESAGWTERDDFEGAGDPDERGSGDADFGGRRRDGGGAGATLSW